MQAPCEKFLRVTDWHLVIEASELGLLPGEFPRTLETNFGNGQPAFLKEVQPDGTHVYVQQLGIIKLAILND